VLRQTVDDLELIVVDDASTDETPAVLAAVQDPRLRMFRNEQQLGLDLERAGDRAGDERAFATKDPAPRPRLERRRDRVGQDDAGLARRREPTVASD